MKVPPSAKAPNWVSDVRLLPLALLAAAAALQDDDDQIGRARCRRCCITQERGKPARASRESAESTTATSGGDSERQPVNGRACCARFGFDAAAEMGAEASPHCARWII